ncbi:DNA-binding protein, partial [Salmonella enterica subsp. salamae]|nr:DNA-binding protein [Salmonella enterica subsp. salamae]
MGRNYAQEESEQIQRRLVTLVRQNGRMSFVRLRKMAGLTIFTMCHQLEKAA